MRTTQVKIILAILCFQGFAITAFGQTYFGITYQGSTFSRSLPNFKNEVYNWNHFTYPNFEDKFEFNNFFHGMGFEWGTYTREGMHVFTGWENKHFSTHGSGNYTNQGRNYEGDITIKIRHNLFHTFGLGYKLSDNFTFGICPLDIGNFKVLKRDTKSTESPSEFVQLYQGNTGLFSQNTTLGMTIYADVYPMRFFRLRASYYFDYIPTELGIDPFYAYQLNSFNLQAAIIIGNKK